jgi:hypothetical protein
LVPFRRFDEVPLTFFLALLIDEEDGMDWLAGTLRFFGAQPADSFEGALVVNAFFVLGALCS